MRRWEFIAWMLAFAIAYTQSPLFFSNQNQYFLHGAALAGVGNLDRDWLANTVDPTPIFSWMIAGLYRIHFLEGVYIIYGALMLTYFASLVTILRTLPHYPSTVRRERILFTLLILAHAALPRWLSVQAFGVDYPWFLQCGVANQYVLGAGLQPSCFGVLLMVSLAALLRLRLWSAGALIVMTCWFHGTYLLPAAILTLGFMVSLNQFWRRWWQFGGSLLLAMLPLMLWTYTRFQSSPIASAQQAFRILAEVRIPHHCQQSKWLDGFAIAQFTLIVVASGLVRATMLGRVLIPTSLFMGLMTVGATLVTWPQLLLLFPWRISVILMPIAVAILACKLTQYISERLASLAILLTLACVVAGVVFPLRGIGYNMLAAEHATYSAIRAQRQPNDVYLIPASLPKLASGPRGVFSTTFTPPPRPQPGSTLIPVDLQRFRLMAEAVIFIDFKSVPYRADEVLEWYRRVQLVDGWYKTKSWDDAILDTIEAEGITHIVKPHAQPLDSPRLTLQFHDEHYRVYRINRKVAP